MEEIMSVFRTNGEAINIFQINKNEITNESEFPITFQFLRNPNYIKVSLVKKDDTTITVPSRNYEIITYLPLETACGALKIKNIENAVTQLLISPKHSVFNINKIKTSEEFPIFSHNLNMFENLVVYIEKSGKAEFLTYNEDYIIKYEHDNTKWYCARIKILKPFEAISKLSVAQCYNIKDLNRKESFSVPVYFNFFNNNKLLEIATRTEDGEINTLSEDSYYIIPDRKSFDKDPSDEDPSDKEPFDRESFVQIKILKQLDNVSEFFIGYKERVEFIDENTKIPIPFQFFEDPNLIKIILLTTDNTLQYLELDKDIPDYTVNIESSNDCPFGYITFNNDYPDIEYIYIYAEILQKPKDFKINIGEYYPIYSSALNVVAYIIKDDNTDTLTIVELTENKEYQILSLKNFGRIKFLQGFSGFSELRIERDIPPEQLDSFCNKRIVLARAMERSLDRQTMLIQDNMSETKRSLRLPKKEAASIEFSDTDMILPTKEHRKGKILGFNQDGNPEAVELPNIYEGGDGIDIGQKTINVVYDETTLELKDNKLLSAKPYQEGKGIEIYSHIVGLDPLAITSYSSPLEKNAKLFADIIYTLSPVKRLESDSPLSIIKICCTNEYLFVLNSANKILFNNSSFNFSEITTQPTITIKDIETLSYEKNTMLVVQSIDNKNNLVIQYSIDCGKIWKTCQNLNLSNSEKLGKFTKGFINSTECIVTITNGKIYYSEIKDEKLSFIETKVIVNNQENIDKPINSFYTGEYFIFPLENGGYLYTQDLKEFSKGGRYITDLESEQQFHKVYDVFYTGQKFLFTIDPQNSESIYETDGLQKNGELIEKYISNLNSLFSGLIPSDQTVPEISITNKSNKLIITLRTIDNKDMDFELNHFITQSKHLFNFSDNNIFKFEINTNISLILDDSLKVSKNKLSVNCDNATIKINDEGKLAGCYKGGTGIKINDNTVAIDYDNKTIKVNEEGELVGCYEGGTGIKIKDNKISVDYDNETIGINKNGKLIGCYEGGQNVTIDGKKISFSGVSKYKGGFGISVNGDEIALSWATRITIGAGAVTGAIGTGLGIYNAYNSGVGAIAANGVSVVGGRCGNITYTPSSKFYRNNRMGALFDVPFENRTTKLRASKANTQLTVMLSQNGAPFTPTEVQPNISPSKLACIIVDDNTILLIVKGTENDIVKIQYSFDNGDSWKYCSSFEIPPATDTGEIAAGLIGNTTYIATCTTDGKIYIAKQTNTSALDFSCAYTTNNNESFINSIFCGAKFFFPLSEGGFRYSTNLIDFTLVNTDKVNSVVNAIAFDEKESIYIFICNDGQVYKTQDFTEFKSNEIDKEAATKPSLKLILKETDRYLIFAEDGTVYASSDLCESFVKQNNKLPAAPTSAVYNEGIWLCVINGELQYLTFSNLSIKADNETIGFNGEGALTVISMPKPNSADIEIFPNEWQNLGNNQWHVEKNILWVKENTEIILEQITPDNLENAYEYGKISNSISKEGMIDIYTYKNIDSAPTVNLSFSVVQQ